MWQKLQSRKLWVAVIGAALAAFGAGIGIDPETVDKVITLLMVYIGGQAVVDTAGAVKGDGGQL